MKRLATAIGLFLVGLLLWGAIVEPRFFLDTQQTEAAVPNLPSQWDGQRIALLADFQVGMWLDNTGMIRRAVQRVAEVNPSLVLIAGDFVYYPDSAVVRHAVDLVRPLVEAGAPVVAVLGNHDYSLHGPGEEVREDQAAYLIEQLGEAGITILENESTLIDGLHVVGIGSHWAGKSRPDVAFEDVPDEAPRVVFMHNPVVFPALPPYVAPLTFAAHTHGGQLRLPLTPSSSWLDIARPHEVIADGWAADSVGTPGNRLYVNRGIGFSIVPVRIRCRPELTLITLSSQD